MKSKLILFIVVLFLFSPVLKAIFYLDRSFSDSSADLHLYVYCFNSQDNKWEIIWSEILNPMDYKEGKLPCYDLLAFEGGILIAVQGQAVYYQNIDKTAGDLTINFSGDPISFHTLDWVCEGINNAKINVSVFIPEMSDYIDLYQITQAEYSEVKLSIVNPLYQYKATITGDDIYTKEIFFSSDKDFKEELMLDEEGIVIFDNPVYLIRKNSIYGSTWYKNSGIKCGGGLMGIFYYDSEGELILVEPIKPYIHNRFLFIIDEEYASRQLCIAGRNKLTNDTLLFDVSVSREPYELFFDEEMAIIGKVSNEYINFPVQVRAYMSYSYINTTNDELVCAGSTSDNIDEIYTDNIGNFHIPITYIGDIISRYPYYNPGFMSEEELFIDLFLYCEQDETAAKLIYRKYLDDKMIERYRKAPMILKLGDIYFREGAYICGYIKDKDNDPVSGAAVYISLRSNYGLYTGCLIAPAEYPDSYSEYLKDLSKLSRGNSVTDDKGFFSINKNAGIYQGNYDLYIYHDRYTLTYYPDISIKKDTDLGDLEINHGNKIILNLITDSDKESIEVKIECLGFNTYLDLVSDKNGVLTYYIERLVSYKSYIVAIYKEGILLHQIKLGFEPDEKNVERILEIIL